MTKGAREKNTMKLMGPYQKGKKKAHQSLRKEFLEVETTANPLPQLNQNIPSGKERLVSFFYWK